MSVVIDVADALVNLLNDGPFNPGLGATRAYRPVFELKDMETLHVTVVPRTQEMELATRNSLWHDIKIDVAIQKRLTEKAEDEVAEADALMETVEAIADCVRMQSLLLPGGERAAWVSMANDPIYGIEHLEKMRQFTSILALTYRVQR